MDTDRIQVTRSVAVPRSEVTVRFSASGGPGGQHANKAATRVELTFDVANSPSLSARVKERMVERLGPVVRIVADDQRSQVRNRMLAETRLADRLRSALHVAPTRRATRPTKGSEKRRLEAKRQRSQTKASRNRPRYDD